MQSLYGIEVPEARVTDPQGPSKWLSNNQTETEDLRAMWDCCHVMESHTLKLLDDISPALIPSF